MSKQCPPLSYISHENHNQHILFLAHVSEVSFQFMKGYFVIQFKSNILSPRKTIKSKTQRQGDVCTVNWNMPLIYPA